MAMTGIICLLLTTFSEGSKKGAAEGIALCLKVLVPSLFPFMAAAGLAVRTGLCQRLGRLLRKPTMWLFGLDGVFAPVILLSLIGGYPVGARAIGNLLREGQVSQEQAKRAALFCVCAGPGFLIGFAGGFYGGTTVGMVLFGAQAASAVVLGIGINILSKKHIFSLKELSSPSLSFGDALVNAASDAARGMVGICSLVVLFGAFGGIMTEVISSPAVSDILLSAMEVCTAVQRLQRYPVEFCAFAVGFGGLCVHCQIFAALGGVPVNKFLFFFIRILQGLHTANFTHLGLQLFVRETAVFSTASAEYAGFFGGSVISGAALLSVAIGFLLTLRKQ